MDNDKKPTTRRKTIKTGTTTDSNLNIRINGVKLDAFRDKCISEQTTPSEALNIMIDFFLQNKVDLTEYYKVTQKLKKFNTID